MFNFFSNETWLLYDYLREDSYYKRQMQDRFINTDREYKWLQVVYKETKNYIIKLYANFNLKKNEFKKDVFFILMGFGKYHFKIWCMKFVIATPKYTFLAEWLFWGTENMGEALKTVVLTL